MDKQAGTAFTLCKYRFLQSSSKKSILPNTVNGEIFLQSCKPAMMSLCCVTSKGSSIPGTLDFPFLDIIRVPFDPALQPVCPWKENIWGLVWKALLVSWLNTPTTLPSPTHVVLSSQEAVRMVMHNLTWVHPVTCSFTHPEMQSGTCFGICPSSKVKLSSLQLPRSCLEPCWKVHATFAFCQLPGNSPSLRDFS